MTLTIGQRGTSTQLLTNLITITNNTIITNNRKRERHPITRRRNRYGG
jgi:hypothetical protein